MSRLSQSQNSHNSARQGSNAWDRDRDTAGARLSQTPRKAAVADDRLDLIPAILEAAKTYEN